MLKYNTPIQVNKDQYTLLMRDYAGSIAGTEINNQYFIKVWLIKNMFEIYTLIKYT